MTADVERIVSALKDEPLWHASMGSKELFHSNLLAWAVERFPEDAATVFEPWLEPGTTSVVRVRREYLHLDLVIELPGHQPLVIENKAFALPDESQLRRYESAIATLPGNPTLVLLSLSDPGWPMGRFANDDQVWRSVSYAELAERLSDARWDGAFAGDVMAHESRLLSLLHELLDIVSVKSGADQFQLPVQVSAVLEEAKVADAVGKARAHQVMARVREELGKRGLTGWCRDPRVGFTNKSPLLDIFWAKGHDTKVGWQYQGGQWRLAMILEGKLQGATDESRRARESFARKHADYFDFRPMYKMLPETLPRDSSRFNHYNPTFV